MSLGIEAISPYVGRAAVGVPALFAARGLDAGRMANLLMEQKSVNLPIEDAITNAVNAAMPLLASLTTKERDAIELVIIGTESGVDFGKPISTYVAHYLELPRRCRSFEVKHACYGGTAALQCALAFVRSCARTDVKALVIAADASSAAARNTYWEPSQGAGAVAMLVSNDARTLVVDQGANGYWSFEVMDTLRPRPDVEAGDSDLSLLSYMSCLEQAYLHYDEVVDGADLRTTFDHLAFHTPFAGMVKAAHKRLMSKTCRLDQRGIEEDFVRRVASSIEFCKKVGNVYSAALYLALCSLLEGFHGDDPARVGLFSYGSGCASEFYSGVVRPDGARALQSLGISAAIADRADLSMADYDSISDLSLERLAGVKDLIPDRSAYAHIYADKFAGAGLLVLDRISNFHRSYAWS